MNKLQYVYNLGIAEELSNIQNDPDKYRIKLESNLALKAVLTSIQRELSNAKSYANSQENPTLLSYRDLLVSTALSFCLYNTQATDKSLTKLTNYGVLLNESRRNVYKDQNTAKGYVGTLLVHQPVGVQLVTTDLDYLEKLLYNYWVYLGKDTLSSPRERFISVLADLGLTIDSNFYLDLTASILEAIANNQEVKRKANSLLLDTEDFKYMQSKMYLLDFEPDLLEFLDYLYTNEYISYDYSEYKYNYLNYGPSDSISIGSLSLVLISLVVEGLVSAAREISTAPLSIQQQPLEVFLGSLPHATVKQNIAKYLTLAFDASTCLSQVYTEFRVFAGSIYKEIQLFIQEDIAEYAEYRIDPVK